MAKGPAAKNPTTVCVHTTEMAWLSRRGLKNYENKNIYFEKKWNFTIKTNG